MGIRRAIVAPAVALGVLAAPAQAPAADHSVTATTSNTFTPRSLDVLMGDRVNFRNGGGAHNVRFDDGSFEMPSEPSFSSWTVQRTFDQPGSFRYYCELHGDPGGVGMAGVVNVGDPATAPPPDTAAPEIERVRARARRGAIELTLGVSEDGTARVVVDRRGRGGRRSRVRTLRERVSAGSERIRIARDRRGRRLTPGSYSLRVTVTDAAGNRSAERTASVRLPTPR